MAVSVAATAVFVAGHVAFCGVTYALVRRDNKRLKRHGGDPVRAMLRGKRHG